MDEPSAKLPDSPGKMGPEDDRPEEYAGESVETAGSENNTQRTSTNPSDYDSYSEAEDEHQERTRRRNSESDSDRSVILEREEGDGQESVPARKIDDDEDKKNPQYIPKRGTFYEHDDRTVDDEEEVVEEKEKTDGKDGKKKIWTDKKEKWNHDKFNDNEQAPKSRSELIAIYGYDIRNEDGPPRARRRRRYGRGPNKYTRNWEDEDAYNKPPPLVNKKITKKPRQPGANNQENEVDEENDRNSEEARPINHQNTEKHVERQPPPPVEQSIQSNQSNTSRPQREPQQQQRPNNSNVYTERQNSKNSQRVGTGRVVKPTREIKDSDYRGFTKPRQFVQQKPKEGSKEKELIQTQNFVNKKNQEAGIEKDMGRLSVQEQGHSKSGKHNNSNRQVSVPPRLQGEQKGSKRYSSIRQRSLPETGNPPFNQPQHNYYGNEFNQQAPVASGQQNQALIQHQAVHPSPPQIAAIPPPPLQTLPPQVPVTTPLPPQFGAPFPQAPPPFLQAPPPPFIPQQTAPLINYVQGQPQYAPPQPPYQGYQPTYNPVSQPTEIFQPPGGITYYSAQDQQAAQRAALQKRPKAAIPIVPPPPLEPRGRGRSNNQEALSPNSADLVVDNVHTESVNYEDVPVQQ